MSLHTLHTIQKLPISLETAWDFISDPNNLKVITPDYMGFVITNSQIKDTMYPGMIISYKVSPILNIPLTWVTEITHVVAKEYFVDEQRFGPYTFWHHQHHLNEIKGGIEMQDIINYKLPMGFLGDIANALFVKRQLQGIFEYRRKVLEDKFGNL